ncbi:S-layer homology domain-containing protein [uncultured Oscillibacter sp.]|uniref:S-layer homology domain-containing protein n=1 Tax=uncultured Oscillibacter sp. TaxID=876091 RepID=UPI002615C5E1|nr:S-layer homology domain-containing protein [uncultured Oscillibacter sp.]
MKKFLSLVLALVMTMSLVTISAGATEYKDLTDKDEIQYEEAVAVLNRIGIITGYEDGSFRPETELTRGAAAKIIVSLMIGPEAASNLSNSVSPYPDVPAGHTFAGVISYCKTAGYISGYGDGTFKPANSLTGYAFAKMLLGAVGYKSDVEGFTGAGWTMNVARLGNEAQLFNRLDFAGADAVNREEACQLALNTLKATMVEYTGGVNINTAAGDTMTVNPTRTYKTSNQSYAANISNRKLDTQGNAVANNHYTVEFGEEHFKDLRLDDDHQAAKDDFGRPSNVWSYKKVTIGTFPVAPDFTFDKQMAYSDKTDAVKNRATGLGAYTLESDEANTYTRFWVNGTEYTLTKSGNDVVWGAKCPATNNETAIKAGLEAKIANISDLTDNGTIVEVYVSEDEADFITDVVVVKSQLMEVKKIGSDYVSLEKKDPDDGGKNFPGFNQDPIDVKVGNVQAEDAAYASLKDLKAGDNVVVIPVDADHDGKDFEVAQAYEPETVSGTLTGVKDYGPTNKTKNAVSLTVGGTEYSLSLWNKDMSEIDGDKIKVTKKDVTLTLDKHGYALLAEDVGSTSEWMIVGSFRSNVENGRIVTVVTGWDISGEPVELNLGPNYDKNSTGVRPGDLVKYTSTSKSNLYDWVIDETGVYNVFTGVDENTSEPYKIKASNVKVDLRGYGDDSALFIDKGVKFIYVSFDVDNEVESIEVKSEVKTVENKELRTTAKGVIPNETEGGDPIADDEIAYQIDNFNAAQAAVTDKGAIKAVVIKQESNEADSASMLYVRDMPGGAHYDSTGKMVYVYTVAMNTADGVREEETIYSYDRLYRGDFASYVKTEHAEHDEFYTLRQRNDVTQRTTSTFQADIKEIVNVNASLVELNGYKKVGSGKDSGVLELAPNIQSSLKANLGVGDEANIVSLRKAVFVDLTDNDVDSFDDLKTFMFTDPSTKKVEKYRQQTAEVQLVVNDNPDTDGFRRVAMVVITGWTEAKDNVTPAQKALLSATIKGAKFSDPISASTTVSTLTQAAMDGDGKISFTHNGDKMEIKLTHNGSTSEISNGSTAALAAGDVITVTVYARNHTDAAPNKADYTFTIGVAVAATYKNAVATGLGVAADNDAADGTIDWTAIGETAIDLTTTPGTLDFAGVVLTGKDEDTIQQLKDALDFVGQEYTTVAKGFNFGTDHLWIITTPNGQLEWDESTAYIFATVDGAKKIIDPANANLDDIGLTANAKVTELNGDVSYVKTADLGTTAVIPGAAYVNDAFVVFNGTAPTHAATGFTVSYTMNGKPIANGDSFDKGSTLVITITADADVANSADVTNAGTLAFASAIPGAVWGKSADTVVGSGSGDTWTFTGSANDVIVPASESITVTVANITADLSVPNLTYTASHA